MWLKNFSRGMPVARATAAWVLLSMVNVVRPSTSAGVSPASASAALTASAARRSSLRPDSLEKSVAPMPTTAARRLSGAVACSDIASSGGSVVQGDDRGGGDVVAETVAAGDRDGQVAAGDLGDGAGHRQGVACVERPAQAPRDRLAGRARARSVGDEALHQAGVGEDVDEDVLRAALARLVAIVVHVLEIPGGQRGADHEG